ncbi:MAG TPA: preprotein translocase subunit YajC [Phycisphaerae bacterium]|nr:preprotein translocase subunit YajC [Phycisphaerales bacterium]HRX86675.1 preprotein translocase subunit YajC [Phycisphaerae bacterium]
MSLATLLMIAQQASPAANPAASPGGGAPTGSPAGGMNLLIGLAFFFGIFYFVLMRGQRKQQKERKSLIDNLAKNDRVLTIGGIVGTVATVRDNEVVIKVDESSNVKMTFLKTAIQRVITETDPLTADEGKSGR